MCEIVDCTRPVKTNVNMEIYSELLVVGKGAWLSASKEHIKKFEFKCKHPGWFTKWEKTYLPEMDTGLQLYCEPGTRIRAIAK